MRRGTIVGAVAAVALAPATGVARAADFAVGSPSDAVDANVGDGKCAAETGGCTLRAAVQEADAAGGASTIAIPAGRYRLTIAAVPAAGSASDRDASNGDLDLNAEITLRGAGAGRTIVDGGGGDRIFEVDGAASAHLSDM